MIITNFGVNWVIRAKYYSFSDQYDKNSYLSTIFLVVFIPRVFLLIFFNYFAIDIFPIIFKSWNILHNELFRIQLLIFLFGFSNEIFFALYVMGKKSKNYSIVYLIQYFITIFISLFYLVYIKKGIISLFYGELVGVFFFQLISFYLFRENIVFQFNRNVVKDIFKIGIPAMPKSLFENVQMNIDKYILQMYLPISELGLFSKSQFLYNGFSGLNKAFSNAYSPDYIKNITEKKTDTTTNMVMLYWLFLISSILVFSILFLMDLFSIIGVNESFWVCAKYAPFYALNVVITSYALMYGNNILISEKTYLFTLRSITCGIINIVANLLLIPRLGISGAIIATLISGFSFFIIEYYFSEKLLLFKTDVKLWIYFLIIAILFIIYLLIYFDILISPYYRVAIMASYISFLFIVDHYLFEDFLVSSILNRVKVH